MGDSEQERSGSESNVESQESRSSLKRKGYSTEKKLEAVDYAIKYSKVSASRKYNVSRSRIQEWVKQEEKLREKRKGSKRLAGAGRHLSFAELDDELAKWVRKQKAAKKNEFKVGVVKCTPTDGPVPSCRIKLQHAREDKKLAELLEEIDTEEKEENFEYDSDISLEF